MTRQAEFRKKAAMQKIKPQFMDQFGQLRKERALLFHVVCQAIQDLVPENPSGAEAFFHGPIISAQMCGVDPDYIRRVLSQMDLLKINQDWLSDGGQSAGRFVA